MTLEELYDLPEEDMIANTTEWSENDCTLCKGQGAFKESNFPDDPERLAWWVVCDCVLENLGEPVSG